MDYKLGEIEMRFASIIWDGEPIGSGELVKLAERELDWKKSTTYTIIRKLCDKGIFKNEGGVVTSLISKDEYLALQSEWFVEQTFSGSLPKFLTAFVANGKLSKKEIEEIQDIIDSYKEV